MAFTWQSAANAFASLFKEIVTVSRKVVTVMSGIENEAALVEQLTELVSPQAAAVEQIAFGALGELIAAVNLLDATAAAGTTGVTVNFDASVVAEVTQLIALFPQVVAQVETAFAKNK